MTLAGAFFASRRSSDAPPARIHTEHYSDDHQPVLDDARSATPQPLARSSFVASNSDEFNPQAADRRSANANLLYPAGNYAASHSNVSLCSTASVTPNASRSSSPAPIPSYAQSGASSCSSDSESEHEHEAVLLSDRRMRRPAWQDRPRWWQSGGSRRRRNADATSWLRTCRRVCRRIIRHPFVPKTPMTIILTLFILTAFGVSLTFLLMYILNPDKEPLPWRGYCAVPAPVTGPPPSYLPPTASFPYYPPPDFSPPSFPPDNFDALSPAGVFVGVFSMDTAFERRMLVRETWAGHPRSRNGAGEGDGGAGTSRTVMRFILGQPRKDWERRIKLEMEAYNDIVILPVNENMNHGKTHAYFTWASENAWVPPLYFNASMFESVPPAFSYSNASTSVPPLAKHDPAHAHEHPDRPWVRPDFIVKADDDSFLMLAELEARLRVALHAKPEVSHPYGARQEPLAVNESSALVPSSSSSLSTSASIPSALPESPTSEGAVEGAVEDPLIYWGYLVKNRFMAGELYALSFSLVEWVARDPLVKSMVRGAEDKQTSKWMRVHPRAEEVRWTSERCWIYDHPRAGTVYSHGFLFPSEVKRVQREIAFDLEHATTNEVRSVSGHTVAVSPFGPYGTPPASWSRSTVSTFGARYTLPISDLGALQSVEALVEGSDMSLLRDESSIAVDAAWNIREGRNKRYNGQRVGGTIVVHFIKKNMWYLEAALAFLEGADQTEAERARGHEIKVQRHRQRAVQIDSRRSRLQRSVSTSGDQDRSTDTRTPSSLVVRR